MSEGMKRGNKRMNEYEMKVGRKEQRRMNERGNG